MGAWGAGSFENDSALDWLGDFRESGDVSLVRAAMTRVVEHGGTKMYPASIFKRLLGRRNRIDWLSAGVASRALAVAEIVAARLGRGSEKLPDGLSAWLGQHASSLQPDIVSLAKNAVGIVKTNSELKDLWEEGGSPEWRNAVEDLERRLNETPRGAV